MSNLKKLTLSQQVYLAGTHDDPIYKASAVDDEGGEYVVSWNVKEEYKRQDVLSIEDEADACDWDTYASITKDGVEQDVYLFDVHTN